jgi:hypothetical protein
MIPFALAGFGGGRSDYRAMIFPFMIVVLVAAIGSVVLLAWAMGGRR